MLFLPISMDHNLPIAGRVGIYSEETQNLAKKK